MAFRVGIYLLIQGNPRKIVSAVGFTDKDMGVEITPEGYLKVFLPEGSRFRIPQGMEFTVFSPDSETQIIIFQMEIRD